MSQPSSLGHFRKDFLLSQNLYIFREKLFLKEKELAEAIENALLGTLLCIEN